MATQLIYAAQRAEIAHEVPKDVEITIIDGAVLKGLVFTPMGGGAGYPILYFHGGGWIVGSPETHVTLCAWLAKVSGRVVTSVRYRLAPEHQYPAQQHDAASALNAFLESVSGRVFLCGDSAGGAMAMWADASAADPACIAGVVAF